jgi:hypothetical protein
VAAPIPPVVLSVGFFRLAQLQLKDYIALTKSIISDVDQLPYLVRALTP